MKRKSGRAEGRSKPLFTAFVPSGAGTGAARTVAQIAASGLVGRTYLLAPPGVPAVEGAAVLRVVSPRDSATMKLIAAKTETPYALLVLHETGIEFGAYAFERFAEIAGAVGEGMLYSDYLEAKGNQVTPHPVIDYQEGALRDDFDFGSLVVIGGAALRRAAREIGDHRYAGFYALRLAIARRSGIFRVAETLYQKQEPDLRKEGVKLFDYVDPRNRDVQLDMERAVTAHLRKVKAYLKPGSAQVDLDTGEFPVTASIVIPVRNRANTIGDAVASALRQQASFPFNVIVVDNHSTDGTTDILRTFATRDARLIHCIPGRNDLGIGGCWNEAVHHAACGRFAAQLDSDDLYIDESTLGRIVECFRKEKCAMVVGAYRMTDLRLREIPPGIIDHREWTADNGRNNALRVNGFGAPRAFFTPVLRTLNIPNVSYGEDYAVGLAISRKYRVGRIYDPIYLCRRWEGNSDADPGVAKMNLNNWYKDKIRTIEVRARRRMNTR
ncbi:MAG TPA: glycosyltransferase family A protein [Bacteroidota bacterium]|nr:glycosyltransferase family A protein [Bacteroidota bacterium]